MRRAPSIAFLAILAGAQAWADGLADLGACLATLAARDPVRATVTVDVRPLPDAKAPKDAPKREPVSAMVEAAASAGSVTVTAPPDLLAALRREREQRREGRASAGSLRSALDELRVDALAGRLDAGGALAAQLAGAKLVREGPDNSRGAVARLLVLQPVPEFDAEARRHLKNFKEELRVWLDTDGCPLASELTSEGKFRFLVVSAEFGVRSRMEFARVGDRLIAARDEREVRGDGMGQHSRDVTTVTVVPHLTGGPEAPRAGPAPSPPSPTPAGGGGHR